MATIATELIDLKRDTKGRQIRTAAERASLVEAYRRSGLTQRAFAEQEGIKYTTFVSWVQESRGAKPEAKVAFAEVRVAPRRTDATVEVQLPDGTVIRGGNAADVAQLLRLVRC